MKRYSATTLQWFIKSNVIDYHKLLSEAEKDGYDDLWFTLLVNNNLRFVGFTLTKLQKAYEGNKKLLTKFKQWVKQNINSSHLDVRGEEDIDLLKSLLPLDTQVSRVGDRIFQLELKAGKYTANLALKKVLEEAGENNFALECAVNSNIFNNNQLVVLMEKYHSSYNENTASLIMEKLLIKNPDAKETLSIIEKVLRFETRIDLVNKILFNYLGRISSPGEIKKIAGF